MSSAEEPLIRRSRSPLADGRFQDDELNISSNNRSSSSHHHDPDYDDSHVPSKPVTFSSSLYIWLLTFSAGISGLLFGCRSLISFPSHTPNSNLFLPTIQTTQASSPRPSSPSAPLSRPSRSHPSTSRSSRHRRPSSPCSSHPSPQ